MKKFYSFMEEKLVPFTNRVASIPFLVVMRNAMMSLVALLVVGSIAAMIAKLPIDAFQTVMAPVIPLFTAINQATTGMMGLTAAIAVGYYGATQYDVDVVPAMLISTCSFLASQLTEDGLNTGGLDSNGLLAALVIGFISVKVMAFLKKKNIGVKMPAGVPEAVAQSLNSLVPITVMVMVFAFISRVLGFEINAFLIGIMQPFANIFNTLPGYVIYHMACAFCFFCGLNSWIIMAPIFPILVSNGAANEAAYLAGETIPYIITNSTDILIWVGGTGATMALVLLMTFRVKSAAYKAVGKVSLLPGIFEINEPVIFGTPICMNPLYFIPFVILPGILAGATYALMDAGIVAMPCIANLTWRTPPILIGYLMSNGHVSTLIWAILVFVITLVVYYPFFKIGDKMEYEKELEAENE
ncbi:PTS sugar transporter subunit IIC [Laedolimicola ammoniilytica]|uniref:Permease IIC component n=1 Tax=Laedolimicola ammoniilytica TaxID=2981771 RepID=A0ABT2RU19_9FIRM|nr:PTS transporter subunit EIIC [Laedolimicola ammoniilytica]MCU6695810.1 PTS transporter subunit EIIC [Laedolimicola ammoniilytica]SCH25522.1 PTS system oligo-beta-mannoside-specific EIIC component [uncultured Clostridium sp.]